MRQRDTQKYFNRGRANNNAEIHRDQARHRCETGEGVCIPNSMVCSGDLDDKKSRVDDN